MKRFSIHILIDSSSECFYNFKNLLDKLSFDEKIIYEITFEFSNLNSINTNIISEFIRIEQEYGKKHKIIFNNILSCCCDQISGKILRCLSRYGIDLIIQFNGQIAENKRICRVIKKIKNKNIPYYLSIKCALEECNDNYIALSKTHYSFDIENIFDSNINLIKEFDDWCIKENDCAEIKTFEDIICKILLGYTYKDCRHNSCLGKRISMESNGDLYFCHLHDEKTFLKNISDVKNISDIFNSKTFGVVLSNSLEKRNKCLKCESFSSCQSGCPLLDIKNDFKCTENRYNNLLNHISEYLFNQLEVKHALPKNPVIRKIILISIAYKGKIKINNNDKGVTK